MAAAMMGFDPSLTSSGFAYRKGSDLIVGRIEPKGLKGVPRLLYIRDQFHELLQDSGTSTVVYEGYSMGSHHGRAFHIGELGGVLKTYSLSQGVSILEIPPTVLKKFMTGKGNAKKDAMLKALLRDWGYAVTQHDEGDAVSLLFLAERYLLTDDAELRGWIADTCTYHRASVINSY